MYSLRRAAAVVLFPVLALWGCAGHPVEPPSPDLEEDTFREHMRLLTSAEFEGRRPGTAGAEQTVAYLSATFKKIGLKPGNGSEFTQPVPLLEIVSESAPQLSFTGRGGRLQMAVGTDAVIRSRRAVPLTQLAGSEVVFAGHGVVAPELGWDDYGAVDVRGKTVLIAGGPPMPANDSAVFKGRAGAKYGQWDSQVQEAARRGASGVLIVHEERYSARGWSVLQSDAAGPQFITDTNDGPPPPAVEGWINDRAARAVAARAGEDWDQLTAAANKRGFTARALSLHADAQIQARVRPIVSANVLALLPGSERPREYVFYVAHWDHLGTREGSGGTQVLYPGAVDDASGVAALLTLAQSISRMPQRPARSIVFLCSTAAESGSLGSSWYVQHPVYPLKSTAAVIDLEQLRPGGPTRDVSVAAMGSSELENYLRPASLLQGRELHADPGLLEGGWYGSDAFSFARVGVPALMARAGYDDTARGPAWGKAQEEDYRQRRFHQPADRYAEDWDVRGILQDLDLYRSVGLRAAHDWRFPNWSPSSEFRPIRERQRPEDAQGRPVPSP